MRPVLLDQLVKQRVLWLMSLILKWANGPEVVLECIGAGHDFLDSARNDKVWNLAIQKLKDTVGSASIEVLKKVLVSSTLELLGTNGI